MDVHLTFYHEMMEFNDKDIIDKQDTGLLKECPCCGLDELSPSKLTIMV